MDREQLDEILERAILVLVMGILVYAPLAYAAVGAYSFGFVSALTMAALGVWLVRLWAAERILLLWPPVCWGVLAFVGYAAIRTAYAEVVYDAHTELMQIAVYGSLFLVILNNLFRQDSIKIITMGLVFLGVGLAFYALVQFLTRSSAVLFEMRPEQYLGRGSGTFVNPNHFAGYLITLIPLAIAFTLSSKLGYSLRIVMGYGALVMLVGVGASLSRGGWMGLLVALAWLMVVVLKQRKQRIIAVVIIGVLIAGGYFIFDRMVDKKAVEKRLQDAFYQGHNRDLRWRIYPAAVQVWQENIWWGVGPAHFDHHYRLYRDPVNRTQSRPRYVHNDFLNTLADYGVVGTLGVIVSLALLFGGAFRTWRTLRAKESDEGFRGTKRAFILGASVGLVALLIHALVDFHFHVPANAILAVTLMALLASHQRFASDNYWISPKIPTKAALTLLVLAAIFYLGPGQWKRVKEEYWQRKALRAKTYPEAQEAWLKAGAVNPDNDAMAFRVGEFFRLWSWRADPGYEDKARTAMEWFARAMQANPYDPFSRTYYGLCLHWLGRHEEARPYFEQALSLDPNNYFILFQMGRHYYFKRQYAMAAYWFDKSRRLNWVTNDQAAIYLNEARRRIEEFERFKK